MRRTDNPRSLSLVIVAIGLGALALAGCTPTLAPAPTPSVSTAEASPTPTPTGPVLVPEGSAEENLPLFAEVMNSVAATDARAQGRAYVDALVAAGFPKSDMEVTNDLTSVGNAADSIQFSVRWGDTCLIGQVGPSISVPTAKTLPVLAGGTCMIGQTRPIDW